MGARLPLLRTQVRDLLELVVLPGVAALLPWSIGYRVLRTIARRLRPYEAATAGAQAQAAARGWLGDAGHWTLVRRIVTLVDHADLYLSRTRSDRWMRRHLDVSGTWPAPGQPGLICTFHWGAGMWGLRHARASGLQAHALVASVGGRPFEGRPVLRAYARARSDEVARVLASPTLDVGASLRPALQALRRGEQVLAAIDVPADQVSASEEIDIAGMRARVPRALLRIAVDQALPVTVYLTGLDVASGRRFLRIHQLGVHDDLPGLVAAVFAYLDAAIREDPPAWHFWGEAPRFFAQEPASA